MKTLIQTLFFFLLVTQIALGQWYQQNSGTIKSLLGVSFTDTNTGTAVGDNGTIIRTTDGGASWTSQASGTTNSLLGVSFTNTNTGTVVGDNGTILRTTNGGTSWTIQSSVTTKKLNGVSFIDENNMIAVGDSGTILRTTNSGITWTSQTSGTTVDLYGISFIDASIGTAVGDLSTILGTTNGGTTWTSQNPWGSDGCLNGVCYPNLHTVVAVGYRISSLCVFCQIFSSTDDGASWTRWGGDSVSYCGALFAVSFTDNSIGTAVGGYDYYYGPSTDVIYRTTDGGSTWADQRTGATHWLRSICLTDANTETAVGDSGTILHTTNGGVSFVEEEKIDKIPSTYILSNNFPNPFNPSTKIKYSIPQSSNVVIKVFDILGNEIETLVNEVKTSGTYELTWNVENLPSGVYFYQLKAGNFVQTKKMILLK